VLRYDDVRSISLVEDRSSRSYVDLSELIGWKSPLEKVLWIIAEQKIVKDYAFAAAKVVQKCRVGKRNNVDR
jgi:hypothetical protein